MPKFSPWARVAVSTFAASVTLWLSIFALREVGADDDFDGVRWEMETVANKALFVLGSPARNDPEYADALRRYFTLADHDSDEARRIENIVEAVIEGRIDAAIRESGIDTPFNLPNGFTVWPPVDIEIAQSPAVLVTSARSAIERLDDRLLRADLTAVESRAIERAAEARDPSISALVIPTGGVAMYPAVVRSSASYRSLTATAAHEWVHHYLLFYPLGTQSSTDHDGLTINETVASIVGDEIADLVIARHGNPAPDRPDTGASGIHRHEVLHDLHASVEALLADGKIAEAERHMSATRDMLEGHGIYIRRINQAYFAFYGTYASHEDAIHPLGDHLIEIRERSGSLSRFVALARVLTSASDVEVLLAQLRASDGQ